MRVVVVVEELRSVQHGKAGPLSPDSGLHTRPTLEKKLLAKKNLLMPGSMPNSNAVTRWCGAVGWCLRQRAACHEGDQTISEEPYDIRAVRHRVFFGVLCRGMRSGRSSFSFPIRHINLAFANLFVGSINF